MPSSAPDDAPTVLIVDDDPVTRTLVRHGLKGLGFGELLEAPDGEAAQRLLLEREVDLVIVDLLMPRLDGLGLIRWARENRPGPVWIILSGNDSFDAAVDAIQVGAFDFLSKPPRLQELEVSARNALEHRRLLRERERLFAELEEANRRLARQVGELEEKSEVIRRDLERAEVIQRALLPAEPPRLERHRVSALYRPGLHVGGDLYQVAPIGPRHLVVCLADATGHGVSSAMLSVLFHRCLVLRDEAGGPLPPAVALERVNQALCANGVAPGLFLTAAYALLDLEAGELVLAGAGHPPALLRSAAGELRRVPRTGPALGLSPGASYAEERLPFGEGDRLLLFTDGLLGGGDPPWERLEAALAAGDVSLDALLEGRAGAEEDGERDDTTVLLLEARPGPSRFDNGSGAPGPASGATRPRESASVWYGEREETSFLAVRGRGTWTEADAFHETAAGLLESGHPLVIDLAGCEYLDSTFLGTVHQVVARAGELPGSALRLQGAHGTVRQAFEELSMDAVLGALAGAPVPLPAEMRPLATGGAAATRGPLRILRAHEALASLSEENREKFRGVVETMRSQLE